MRRYSRSTDPSVRRVSTQRQPISMPYCRNHDFLNSYRWTWHETFRLCMWPSCILDEHDWAREEVSSYRDRPGTLPNFPFHSRLPHRASEPKVKRGVCSPASELPAQVKGFCSSLFFLEKWSKRYSICSSLTQILRFLWKRLSVENRCAAASLNGSQNRPFSLSWRRYEMKRIMQLLHWLNHRPNQAALF